MAHSFRRLLINGCLGLFILVAVAVLCVNCYLILTKESQVRLVNGAVSPARMSASSIYFCPPNFLFLENVTVSDGRDELLVIPTVRFDVSLPAFFRKQLSFSKISFYSPGIYAMPFTAFVRKNAARLQQLLEQFKSSCGGFFARDIRVFESPGKGTSEILFSFRKGLFQAKGVVTIPLSLLPGKESEFARLAAASPVEWSMRGSFSEEAFSVEKLELRGERLAGQFWGELSRGEADIHGFLLLDRSAVMPVIALDQTPVWAFLFEQTEMFLKNPQALLQAPRGLQRKKGWEDMGPGNTVVEVDCTLGLQLPRVKVKRLSVMVDKTPVTVKGELVFGETLAFGLDFASSVLMADAGIFCSLSGWAEGSARGDGIKGDGEVTIDFHKKKAGYAPRAVRVGVNGFSCFPRPSGLRFAFKKMQVAIQQDEERRLMRFDDAVGGLHTRLPRYWYLSLSAGCAGGYARGTARFDPSGFPRIKGIVSLRKAKAEELSGLDDYFSHISGEMDSVCRFDDNGLEGRLHVRDGILNDFSFFVWLEEYFNLPGLTRIDFDELGTEFWVTREGAGLRSLDLKSAKADISGDYGLLDGRVNGNLTLALSRGLLSGSRKFAQLLNLVDEKRQRLNLAFQLSGRPEALNFQWLQSDFKRELQAAIPGFVERAIERNVEQMIQNLPSE